MFGFSEDCTKNDDDDDVGNENSFFLTEYFYGNECMHKYTLYIISIHFATVDFMKETKKNTLFKIHSPYRFGYFGFSSLFSQSLVRWFAYVDALNEIFRVIRSF